MLTGNIQEQEYEDGHENMAFMGHKMSRGI